VKRLFSLGGDPAIEAAVGLLARRCVRLEESCTFEAREIDPERFKAMLILALSDLLTFQMPFSPSEEELLPLSSGVESLSAACIRCKDERLVAFDVSMVRRGD
jgi:hypothetical protein